MIYDLKEQDIYNTQTNNPKHQTPNSKKTTLFTQFIKFTL